MTAHRPLIRRVYEPLAHEYVWAAFWPNNLNHPLVQSYSVFVVFKYLRSFTL